MRIFAIATTTPIAQPRQRTRAFLRHGKVSSFNYTPKKSPVNSYKECVRDALRDAYSGPVISAPVCVRLIFVMPRPRLPKKLGNGRLPHCKRPDADNLAKSTLDAMSGTIIKDDAMIHSLSIEKVIASEHELPHVEIEIVY